MDEIKMYKQSGYKGYIATYRFSNEYGELLEPKTKRLSQKKYSTKALALKAAKAWVKDTQERYDNKMKLLTEVPTFGDFYEHYWKPVMISKEGATQTNIRLNTTLRQQVLHPLFKMKLTKITTGYLQRFFEDKRDVNITNKRGESHKPTKYMLKNWREAIATIFNEAIHQGFVLKNPTRGLDMARGLSKDSKLKEANKDLDRSAFTLKQCHEIFQHAEQLHPEVAPIFELMLRCGLRTQEVIGLAVEDINLKTNRLRVRRAVAYNTINGVYTKEPKTGKSRTVAFNNQAAQIFKKQVSIAQERPANLPNGLHSLFVRNRNNELWYTNKIATLFSEARAACPDMPPYSMYALRHTYATVMVSHHFSFPAIAQQMGHTLPVFMKYYVHALDDDVNDIQNFDF